jgi:hypothetical protein
VSKFKKRAVKAPWKNYKRNKDELHIYFSSTKILDDRKTLITFTMLTQYAEITVQVSGGILADWNKPGMAVENIFRQSLGQDH